MAAVSGPIFHVPLPSSLMMRQPSSGSTTVTSNIAGSFGGVKRPPPLNLTYSISRIPSRDGTPLVSPATLTRAHSHCGPAERACTSPVPWKPSLTGSSSPRTPVFRHLPGVGQRRASTERTPTSAGFLTRRFSMPSEGEQDNFEQLCKARFYEQDRDATLQIEEILKQASVTAQSCYNKILSTVRQQYHEDVSRQRKEALKRVLLEARPDLELSKEERRARAKSFLETYASKEVIGTHPFLKGLYTVLYVQTIKDVKGGAGGKCVEWALQEEVFMEAGTGQWTNESVALLKTILAMTDVTEQEEDINSPFYAATRDDTTYGPNLDANDGPGPHGETLSEGTIRRLRMSPNLANPELLDLLAVFPSWISQGRPREYRFTAFPQVDALLQEPTVTDMEEGVVGTSQEKVRPDQSIRISHGRIRISPEDRESGFEGSLVERVTGWFKRLFGTV